MKTRIICEIETKDFYEVFPEEGQSEDDYDTDEKRKELKEFRENYTKDLHQITKDYLLKYLKDDIENNLEDRFFDDVEELSIEGWETFDDYGIKITYSEEKRGG